MNAVLVDVHLHDDVCRGYVLILIVKVSLRINVRQDVITELVTAEEDELRVLVDDPSRVVLEEIAFDMETHFLLFVLDVS